MNRAEKYAVRWCHLPHQVIAGASVHSREPKARVAEVYSYFVSKRFINHIVLNMSCQTCPAHIVKCHNAKTGITVTLLTIIFEPSTAAIDERHTRFKFRHHHDTSPNKNQFFCFILDTLAVRLLSSSFTFCFCKLQLSIFKIISKHMRNYARCYDLMC